LQAARDKSFQSTPPVSGRRCRGQARRAVFKTCFNPRPPFPGGDALRYGACKCLSTVSIHAPRFREAMRCVSWRKRHCVHRFNPRPPFPGGDARYGWSIAKSSGSFNPRPPFPGGDAIDGRHARRLLIVSIHAPRFREAMLISRNYRKHQNKKPALREPLYS